MINNLCIITSYYPSKEDPHYAFVGTLVEAFADMGIECTVISPSSWIEKKHKAKTRVEYSKKGKAIRVYCPRFFVFPNRNILGFRTYKLTVASENRAIWRVFKKHIKRCDAIYSHFVSSGVSAATLNKKTGLPAFLACGESNIYASSLIYETSKDILSKNLSGIIAVSSELKDRITEIGFAGESTPIKVVPNAINLDVFHKENQQESRKKKGYNGDDFVIAFVGGYIKRKGFDILQTVLTRHQDWKCILIGRGEIPITLPKEQVLFSGKLSHDMIPEYLNCADVFVLPTLEEGCCNAIIEAMGCGLPIISSDRRFNDDILNEKVAIRIDPEKADEIEAAIMKIYEDKKLRKQMSINAELHAKDFSIEKRARSIISFIEDNIR